MEQNGYLALDLSGHANAGAEVLLTTTGAGTGASVTVSSHAAVGEQLFRGIPFQVGDPTGSGNCLVLLDGAASDGAAAAAGLTIQVGRAVHRVLFAHRLLDSDVYRGGPIGGLVADYVIGYADGTSVRVPIRERYEIGIPDERWTQQPFLAVADQDYTLPPRWSGRWEDAGLRQTETAFDRDVSWYLYPWRNPHPELVIATIEIVPAGPRFVLAGITLGLLDEEPFRHAGIRDVVLTLPRAEDAASTADLAVTVDRGLASYPQPLPAAPAAAFLADPMRGWGEARATAAGRAHVGIAATASATIAVNLGDEEVSRVAWADLQAGQPVAVSPRLGIELVDRGRNWVHTTVVDDKTGQPIPCRIHFRSPVGIAYAPHGHHAHLNSGISSWHNDIGGDVRLGQISYAYIDGTCEGWLPRGDVIVDVAQGFEYEPLRTTVTIAPGQERLELRLRRWTDMNRRGWYSGDTHVHFLSPQGGLFEARGEGLNVVNLLQAEWGSLFTNTEDFTGEPQVSTDRRTIVYTSQENREHVMGHLSLLGLKRPVMPWSSDGLGEGERGGTLETVLAHWADRCHEQGGTVVIPHFPSPNGEPAVLISTGRADAIEMIRFGLYEHLTWYRYLNAGYRVPLAGGTDKMSSETPVGLVRTYVRVPADEDFSYDAWCRNLRLGRTFQTSGPMLELSVNGAEIGDTVELPAGGGSLEIRASAESLFPIHVLELVQNGQVVATTSAGAGGARRLELRETVKVEANSWFAVRAGGPGYWQPLRHHDEWSRGIFAHTSPVYVAVGGPWWQFDPATANDLLALVNGGLQYVREMGPQYPAGSVTHHHGEADHQAYVERPFHEALAAIRQRLETGGRPPGD